MKKRIARQKNKVDWEKLAKDLQQALAKEIQENDELEKLIKQLDGAMNISASKLAVAKKQIDGSRAQIKGESLGGGRYKPVIGTPTETQKRQWEGVKKKTGWT